MTADHFLPVAKLPKRRGKCCSDWAVSLYQTEDQAKDAHAEGCRNFPNFRKNGDHLAAGILDAACGVVTEPDSTGHFDLHEFDNANLSSRFTIKCPL